MSVFKGERERKGIMLAGGEMAEKKLVLFDILIKTGKGQLSQIYYYYYYYYYY